MRQRRLLLPVLAALTGAVLLVDLARPAWTEPVRDTAATVLGPVQQALAGWGDDDMTALTQERNELAARVAQLESEQELAGGVADLERTATWGGHRLLPARVVGFAPVGTPVGSRLVTIDVGADEGVEADQTVVDTRGLVGRVLRVGPTTADVALLGDAEVVVGVRVGDSGAMGSVQGRATPGLPPRSAGQLTLTMVGDTVVHEGDKVSTLGSPDSVPYAAGIPLGTVTSVDPDAGQLGHTAVVTPFVDIDTLDLVAVVFVEPR